MTRLEKIEMAIEKGYTCDPESGKVYGFTGKELISKHSEGYMLIRITKDKKPYHLLAHQFIWYWVHKTIVKQIDHINGVRDDNRIDNLRAVTNQQNCFNKKETKGYYCNKVENKWMSQIMLNGKSIHLGTFNNEEEARQAYLDAKEIYHII